MAKLKNPMSPGIRRGIFRSLWIYPVMALAVLMGATWWSWAGMAIMLGIVGGVVFLWPSPRALGPGKEPKALEDGNV